MHAKLTAGALALVLLFAAMTVAQAKSPPPPADDGIAQPVLVGE